MAHLERSAMLRGVDDFEILFREFGMDLAGFDELNIGIIHFFPHHNGFAFFFRLGDLNREFIGIRGDVIEHRGDGVGNQLAAGFIIDFVTVILLGVMAGGDHDAADGFFITDRIGKLRGWAKVIEDIDLEPHLIEDIRALEGEVAAMMTVIMGDGDPALLPFFAILVEEHPPKGNGRFFDREFIEPVGARA